jgi:hypothetical protein
VTEMNLACGRIVQSAACGRQGGRYLS